MRGGKPAIDDPGWAGGWIEMEQARSRIGDDRYPRLEPESPECLSRDEQPGCRKLARSMCIISYVRHLVA
jgi:hypothetical protein